MTQLEQFFFVVGGVTCALGAVAIVFAVVGLIFWQGIEWWIKFNTIRGPLMRFYADELKRKHDEEFGHD